MNRKDINKLINLFFPLSSEFIGSPRKKSTVSESLKVNIGSGQLEYEYNIDTSSFFIDFPSFFSSHTLIPTHNLFLASLKNARIWGRNGAVVDARDHFLENVSREFNNGLQIDHSIFYTLKQIRYSTCELKTAVIGTAGANTYYHWMMDILPRLGLIAAVYTLNEISFFVTEFSRLPFQVETLQKIGIPINKIIASNDNWNFHIKCNDLIVPSMVSPVDHVNTFQVDFLRSLYRDCIRAQSPEKCIYISRSKAGSRVIVNESELLKTLSKHGFEIVYCEDLTIEEQVHLFSSSSFIVCSHGSALANLVFCNPKTIVIDIFNEKHINPCFWFISRINKLNYHYFLGKAVPIDENPKNDNTWIDVSNFLEYFYQIVSAN